MRKTFLTITSIFIVIGTIFSFLPLDTLALIPLGIALIFGVLTFLKSTDAEQKQLPKWLVIFSLIFSIFVVGKTYLIKDEVAKDTNFEQQKVESKKQDVKELEELEDLK